MARLVAAICFQANQAWGITKTTLESRFGMVFDGNESMYFGIMMAILVGLVIIGGIKRIGSVTEKIIPIMCGIYVLASLVILGANASELPAAVGLIFSKAFSFRGGCRWFRGYRDSRHQTSGILERGRVLVRPRLHTLQLKPTNQFAKGLFHFLNRSSTRSLSVP